MIIEKIKEIYNNVNEVHFKIYSLEYTIKKENERTIIYADLYSGKKESYNNIDELLNNFTIYNETLIDNESRILII